MVFKIISISICAACVVLSYCYIKVRKQNRWYKVFFEIENKLRVNIKLSILKNEILDMVKAEVHSEACTFYLVNQAGDKLIFDTVLGTNKEMLEEMSISIDENTIAGYVAKTGKPLNIKNISQDERFNKNRKIAHSLSFTEKAILTVPVKYRDKVIGVVQVINKINGRCFTKRDEKNIDMLSIPIAIAVENSRLYEEINCLFEDSITALANAIDAKDPYTNGHSERVRDYSVMIAKEMGFADKDIEEISYMAILHDIGKIGIGEYILNKPTVLTQEEFETIKKHVDIGTKILEKSDILDKLSTGVRYHHEKINGKGYPNGLSGNEIPIAARIIAAADSFDAMTTDRPYKSGLKASEAIYELTKQKGEHFDPLVVDSFILTLTKNGIK